MSSLVRFPLRLAAMALLMTSSWVAAAPPATGKTGTVTFFGRTTAPDISGVWLGTSMGIPGKGPVSNSGETADGRPPSYWTPWPLPYTPAYQKIYDERAEALKRGVALGDTGSRCLPFGLPNMLASQHYPEEVVQTPGQVTFFIFGTFPIVVWTDGRPHPKNLTPSYNGHSIGHWVADMLFVDTVGILANTPLDSNRDPHSAKIHMKWTVQRVADDVLHIHLTLYDEDAFTMPVTMTNISVRKNGPEWAVLDDQSCFENNREVPLPDEEKGFTKF